MWQAPHPRPATKPAPGKVGPEGRPSEPDDPTRHGSNMRGRARREVAQRFPSVPFRRFLAKLHRSNHARSRKDDENGALRGAGRSGYREYPQDRQQCSASFLARPCAGNFRNGTLARATLLRVLPGRCRRVASWLRRPSPGRVGAPRLFGKPSRPSHPGPCVLRHAGAAPSRGA